MRVLFRVDSSLRIGTGHVMRCLTLANALRERGVEAIFLTRTHTGHVVSALAAAGYGLETMPGNTRQPYGAHPSPPPHAAWLEADWRADAAQTRATLEETGADWLVVDHYALDKAWQEAAMPEHVLLLVIDDLADRPHQASLLVDQNFGRSAADYTGLVPAGCELQIGPANALLRPEFSRLRRVALARRDTMVVPERLLITLGGVDLYNRTGLVLNALAVSPRAIRLKITVVLGESAPHLAAVRTQARNMPMQTDVAVNVSDMAERMVLADLCIGAAGSTAWERCALGLPTLQMVLADNQISAASHMADEGLTIALPFTETQRFAEALETGLVVLGEPNTYKNMAHAAAALTDGRGAARLARDLLERTSNDAN